METMEQDRIKSRRDLDELVSEMSSVLHVDSQTVSLALLKHKVKTRISPHVTCQRYIWLANLIKMSKKVFISNQQTRKTHI